MIHKFFQWILFILGFDCDIHREMVDEGLADYSGQGRNQYGRRKNDENAYGVRVQQERQSPDGQDDHQVHIFDASAYALLHSASEAHGGGERIRDYQS